MRAAIILLLLATNLTTFAQARTFQTFDNDIRTQRNDPGFSIPDSLDHYFKMSMETIRLNCLRYYSLSDDGPNLFLYFDMARHYAKNEKTAIVAFMLNDTTVWCDIYTLKGAKWTRSGKECLMHIDAFHPAYFHSMVDDFNFDGHNDLFFNFYHTMGVVYGHGYLMTYNPQTKSMKLHPETMDIASIEIDKKHKSIISVHYSNPNNSNKQYKETYQYKWKVDSLQLVGKKRVYLK